MKKASGFGRRKIQSLVILLGATFLLAIPLRVSGQEDESNWEWAGSTRTFTLIQRQYGTPLGPAQTTATGIDRVRLEGRAWAGELLSLEVGYDLVALGGSTSAALGENLTLGSGNLLRWEDLHSPIEESDTFSLRQNLDRLAVSFHLPFGDLSIGRQAIGHGSGRIFNPTDIFGPFSHASLDTEYKTGVDALRVSIPLGQTMGIEAIAVAHSDDVDEGIYLGRWHSNFSPVDLSLYGGTSYGDPTVGVDLAGDLAGEVGWYTEALFRSRKDATTTRATLGLHHRFKTGVTTILEGHYNEVGEEKPENYLSIMNTPEFQHGELFLLGRQYLALALTYEWMPLLTPTLSWIQNIGDNSALLSASMNWNFAEEVSVNAGALLGLGKRPDATLTLQSEFGTVPNLFYTDVRLYF